MSLKELSKELLAQLKRHPQSGRQLAAAVGRNNGTVGKTLRRLEKLGYIRRAYKKWVYVTSEPVLEAYRKDWSVEEARDCYLGGLFSETSLANPGDLTLIGVKRRQWDEAVRYLEHHHPETLDFGRQAREQMTELFNTLRQAYVHDPDTFRDIVAALIAEQTDLVADRIRAYRCIPEAHIDGDRLFFVWLLLGSPEWVPNSFYFPEVGKPDRDEAALRQAWNIAYNDEHTFTAEIAPMIFDMLVVLDENGVLAAFEEHQGLNQKSFTANAATEPLGAQS
ncbi:MAG TPA: winged helix-turn-helix domain-containing protein [Vicinamibacterales bacterium]